MNKPIDPTRLADPAKGRPAAIQDLRQWLALSEGIRREQEHMDDQQQQGR